MSRRAKPRGHGPHGLFIWDGADPTATVPAEVRDNPLRRPCPKSKRGCGAQISEPCTRPVRGGRRNIKGYHEARQPQSEQTPRSTA